MNRNFSANGTDKLNSFIERQRRAVESSSPVLDEINRKFLEAEKQLKAAQPVADVGFAIRRDGCTNHCLGFLKNHLGEWRLSYGVFYDQDDEPMKWRPITDASRQIRVEVASAFDEHFSRLQKAVAEAEEEFEAKARKALALMTKTLG